MFRKLQEEALDDAENADLLVENSPETKEFFDQLFNTAVSDPFGFALLVADKGMILVTEAQTVASFKLGKIASITAAFVSPGGREMGIEKALLKAARERAADLGYDGITFSTPAVGTWSDEAESEGFAPFMLHFVSQL